MSLTSQPEKWSDALAAGEQEIRKAYHFGFTQAELNEQLANTRTSLETSVQTASTRRTPGLARRIQGSFHGDNVMTAPTFDLEFFESYAGEITPEKVHEAFKAQWDGFEDPQIYLSTSEMIENPEATILAALDASQNVDVQADIAKDLGEFSYTDFGTPGKIAERKTIEDIDFETIRFDNNVQLNIKKTPYEDDIIHIRLAYGTGQMSIPNDKLGLSWLASNVLSLGGLEAHSADDIRTLMAGKNVGASFDLGNKRTFMRGSTTPGDLPEQLNFDGSLRHSSGLPSRISSALCQVYRKFLSHA